MKLKLKYFLILDITFIEIDRNAYQSFKFSYLKNIMPMIWDQKYEVGHDRIDAEHRIFFSLVADFKEAQLAYAPKAKLLRILNEISKYAEFHFLSEENIMTDHGYTELKSHQELHLRLLAELKNKRHEFNNDMIHADEIFNFIFLWFALHTSNEDKKLADCLKLA